MNGTQHLSTGRCHYVRMLLVIVAAGGALLALHLFLAHPLEPVLAQRHISPQAEAGTIAIRPSSTTVGVGEEVTVEVWLEDVGDYYTVDFRFSFDPNLVSVPSGEVAPLWDVFDEENSYGLLNEADNVSGTVRYAVTNLNPAEPFTGTGRVCAVTFSGLAEGTTSLDFTYVQGGTRRGIGLYPAEINGQIIVGDSGNTPPTANPDTATVDEDSADNVIDVLDNDSDPDPGDTLSVTSVGDPDHGSATNNTTDVSYTPDPNFCGSDTFVYTVSDGHGGSDTATVNVSVICINDAPVANDDSASTDEGTSVLIDLVANDTDIDGSIDPTTVIIVTGPSHGSLTVGTDGTVTYTPDADYIGDDSFTYTVDDDEGATSNVATVSVAIGTADEYKVCLPLVVRAH